MSKYQYQQSNIYLPDTEIPRNLLGITDEQELHEIEKTLLESVYEAFIEGIQSGTRFDEGYYISLHRRGFSQLYEWAGQYRTVDMSKGGSVFCRADYLQHESRRIFTKLEAEGFLINPAGWEDQDFAGRLAYYQAELIALHPFLELNGRITRLFFDLIAIANGYGPIDYSPALVHEPEQPNEYIQASIECVRYGDIARLQAIILSGLQRE